MAELSEAAIAELKSKNPGHELNLLTAPDGTNLVVRSPDRATYNVFQSDIQNERKDNAITIEGYVKRCVVYPDLALVDQMFTRYPAFPNIVCAHLHTMAGLVEELDAKKL